MIVANAPLPNPISPAFLACIIEDRRNAEIRRNALLQVEELFTRFLDDCEENIHAIFRNAGIELEELEDEDFIRAIIAEGMGVPEKYI